MMLELRTCAKKGSCVCETEKSDLRNFSDRYDREEDQMHQALRNRERQPIQAEKSAKDRLSGICYKEKSGFLQNAVTQNASDFVRAIGAADVVGSEGTLTHGGLHSALDPLCGAVFT